ncbi:hypothetical protein [Winogradskyella sp. SYSU M77433]|uniref:hypothetical protein n=1 Tax=Winogradskyella sp. SYSU M77433 TaxID=3042722 RepID=UPI0024813E3A|nr:hypothetical protein [Winogradskyella sp. SYSU M77433]MDH7914579.1 hypothetical protein [Winogradskyella sp. SYSU M77433]
MKNLKILGKVLSKTEQQSVNGGAFVGCENLNRCYPPSNVIINPDDPQDGGQCSTYFPTYGITCSNGTLQNNQCCFG